MSTEIETNKLQLIAEKLCKEPASNITDGDKGANSRIFKVDCKNKSFALKFYRALSVGECSRIVAETRALFFFEKYGMPQVPKLIAFDLDNNCSLIEWINGEKLGDISKEKLETLAAFLGELHQLRSKPEADEFTLGTEACLCVNELLRQLNMRFERLNQATELEDFLYQEFAPAIKEIGDWAKKQGLDVGSNLSREMLTLSPVDFGFHNTLLTENDSLAFLDFEYFGWADPVNLISDTLLHPASKLSKDQRQLLFSLMSKIYEDCDIKERLKVFYPLYGLRWCAIMLNQFLPGYVMPGTENLTEEEKKNLREEKLNSVKRFLEEIHSYKEEFPYV